MMSLLNPLQSKVLSKNNHQWSPLTAETNWAVGRDDIPIASFLALVVYGIDILIDMLNSCLTREVIPNEWRQSTLTPIYNIKSDHMDCSNTEKSNYCAIE